MSEVLWVLSIPVHNAAQLTVLASAYKLSNFNGKAQLPRVCGTLAMWMWMRDLVAWRRLMWTLVLACWTAGFGPCVCDCMPSVDQVSSSALSLLLSVTSRLSVWAPWAPVCLYVTFCFVMVTGIMLFVDRLCCHVSMDLFLLLLVKCLLFFV